MISIETPPALWIFRRELIARDADRSDLRLGRQRAALEAVDADDGARAGHVLQLLLQRRRIVRQRFDLIARQRRAERSALRIGGRLLLVLLDGHRGFELRDRSIADLPVLAAANADILQRARLESRKLGLDRVAARRQAGERRDAAVGGLRTGTDLRRCVAGSAPVTVTVAPTMTAPLGSTTVTRKRRVRGLRMRRPPRDAHASRYTELRRRHTTSPSFRRLELSARSIFALMRMRSNVVSSIVWPPTARRMRKGHFRPLTSRKSAKYMRYSAGAGWPGRGLLPHQHHRQMRVLLHDQTRREIGGAGHVEHVGFAFRGFADSLRIEGQREARKRRGEHAQHQPREVLFDGREPLLCGLQVDLPAAAICWRLTAGSARRRLEALTAGPRTSGRGPPRPAAGAAETGSACRR